MRQRGDLAFDKPQKVEGDHALLTLAAMQVGTPVAPLSPTYSRLPEARHQLSACLDVLMPGPVMVECAAEFGDALTLVPAGVEVVAVRGQATGRDATPFETLLEDPEPARVDAAFAAVDPDAPAKILFTSGSTGGPKAAIVTHRMMCSDAVAQRQLLAFLAERPPVVVDWQPWHHCGGGANSNYHAALLNGGSYYINSGKPTTEEAFAPTLHALKSVSPTIHFNVPQGYAMLAFHLERDPALRAAFFADLDCLAYSAAAMPGPVWDALAGWGQQVRGVRLPMISCYGMTELAPMHTALHWYKQRPGLIGLPIPGSEVLLLPVVGGYELRARGPNVSPGYFRNPALTAEAFDAEGWFVTGDRVSFVDPDDPARKNLVAALYDDTNPQLLIPEHF
ncbi:feruloyl-CoA synthase [Aquamicrobium defluvii]|uniref:AMP-binding enzyme n=2 Tax=Aquamicrobium defluvii TaxID=69279 RepID=A0A011UT99_9HYPH|nr:feruloyl-CoA synthase [Aquamicrobium defluvii]TDR33518.1 AMP-binding enzyme [Aquamicrobium defluvii]